MKKQEKMDIIIRKVQLAANRSDIEIAAFFIDFLFKILYNIYIMKKER